MQDLIQKLLVVDLLERLTAEQALRHEWIVENLSSNDLSDSIIDKMRELLKVS